MTASSRSTKLALATVPGQMHAVVLAYQAGLVERDASMEAGAKAAPDSAT
jgi:hypothetical protein